MKFISTCSGTLPVVRSQIRSRRPICGINKYYMSQGMIKWASLMRVSPNMVSKNLHFYEHLWDRSLKPTCSRPSHGYVEAMWKLYTRFSQKSSSDLAWDGRTVSKEGKPTLFTNKSLAKYINCLIFNYQCKKTHNSS